MILKAQHVKAALLSSLESVKSYEANRSYVVCSAAGRLFRPGRE